MILCMSIAHDAENGSPSGLAAIDINSGEKYIFRVWDIDQGLELIRSASKIIMHDADISTLSSGVPVIDTAVCSRLALADKLYSMDGDKLSKKYRGSHSIQAYCLRLSMVESDHAFIDADQWCDELDDQLSLFAEATLEVYNRLKTKYKSLLNKDSLLLEHKVSKLLKNQKPFRLNPSKLDAIIVRAESVLTSSTIALRSIDRSFNGTDDSIISLLTSAGWEPKYFTKSGKASTKAEHIRDADVPFVRQILSYKAAKKVLEYTKTGQHAWSKLLDYDGSIKHTCTHIGAGTHRAAHTSPNLAAVPSASGDGVKLELGRMCREAFGPGLGCYQVGADLKGIELRMLAHYLYPFDGGRYIDIVTKGDVHQENADALGVGDRALAKKFIYAYIYGAGFDLIAQMLMLDGPDEAREVCKEFDRKLGLDKLKEAIRAKVKAQGFFKAIDGRIIFCTEEHKALNYLLQSGGAIVAKRWIVNVDDALPAGARQMIWVHDEIQLSVETRISSEQVTSVAAQAALEAGVYYKLRLPINADVKIGASWHNCH